jgi:hypothetical protein
MNLVMKCGFKIYDRSPFWRGFLSRLGMFTVPQWRALSDREFELKISFLCGDEFLEFLELMCTLRQEVEEEYG